MKKDDLDEYGFNKNHSYNTNVDHYEFNHNNNDGMFIDENGSVRYGKPTKKTKKKKAYNPQNNSPNKNLKIALITIGIILGVFIFIIPICSSVLDKIIYLNSTYSYNSSDTADTYTDNTYTDDIYNDTYLTEDEYVDYDFNNGYLSISSPNNQDTAVEISKVINYDSFNNFTLTYNDSMNFDDFYLNKYNEVIKYCTDHKLDYSLPSDSSLHYVDIYGENDIDYLNVHYYNDQNYDYSYFEILLLQDYDNLSKTQPIDTVFSEFTSSLGDNSQQICETFKRLSAYCYNNSPYLSGTSFYGTIYGDNYSVYYDYSNDQLVLSVTIENPNYYDTSF